VGAGREDHFSETEVAALIKAAREDEEHFANLLEAAFHSGARLGELVMLDVKHFDAKRHNLHIPGGKTGSRHTTLTAQAVAFFERISKGRAPSDVLLPRADGERWQPDEQRPRLCRALQVAGLPASACFYTLRHSHISRAIERGIPLRLISTNVGTSVRMIEMTYSKFIVQTRRDLIWIDRVAAVHLTR
jgi:integrase